MKDLIKNNKKNLLNLLIILIILIAVSALTMTLLVVFKVIYFVNGDMHFNESLFEAFKESWYGWIIVMLLQVVLTSLLCFIPGVSMAFILLSKTLYSDAWMAFGISFTSVMLTSIFMYCVGRFGGYRLCVKLLGRKDCHKAITLLRNKGQVYFPFMMLFPIFPDDALIMMAGTIRMTLRWFIPSVVIGRGIGVATIVFGLSIIPFDKFTSPWHWVLFVLACVVVIALVLFLANRFNKFMENKKRMAAEASAAPAGHTEQGGANLPEAQATTEQAVDEQPSSEKSE